MAKWVASSEIRQLSLHTLYLTLPPQSAIYALPALGEHPRQEQQDSSTQHPLHTPYVNGLLFLNKLKALAHPRRAGRTYTYPMASAFANATRTDVRGCRSCAEKQRGVWPIAPFPIARRPGESLSP